MGALLSRLLRLADVLAMAALAFLLATVAFSILGRLLFDLTGQALNLMIPGAIEISRHALLVLVLAALPRATEAGLVRVDLIIEHLPAPLAGTLGRLWHALAAGLAAALTWLFAAEARLQFSRGDATQDLALPLWPFSAFAAVAAALLAATALSLATGRRP